MRLVCVCSCILFLFCAQKGVLRASAALLDPPHDPLHLGPWLTNEPVASRVFPASNWQRRILSSSLFSSSIFSSSSSSKGIRRLLGLLHPNSLDGANIQPSWTYSSTTTRWVTACLDPSTIGASIPKSFLGISHEWTNVEELNQGGSYLQLLRDLTAYGSGPLVLRVGGGSTDIKTDVPAASTWEALRHLQQATGMTFIFGLNFEKQDVSLALKQMDAISAQLPRESIAAFEVGNEPNFYLSVNGKTGDEFLRCCFVNEWNRFARLLSCRNGSASCIDNQLAGPAWGHVNMMAATLDWFLKVNYRWLSLVTVHWYKASRDMGNTVNTLLDEAPLRAEMANLQQLVQTSKRWGKELRVAEMNTISNNGQRGISNSLAAALWTLDGAFEVAAAGAAGINLHWGDGLAVYAALLRQSGGSSIVKPPYYAYLLFQMALGSGASFMGRGDFQSTADTKIKIWPLRDTATGAARIVIINKHATETTGVVIRFPGNTGYQAGKLIRLMGQRGLEDEWSVSLGNMTYAIGGRSFGIPAGEVTSRAEDTSGQGNAAAYPTSYTVYMPAGSAALLTLPKVT